MQIIIGYIFLCVRELKPTIQILNQVFRWVGHLNTIKQPQYEISQKLFILLCGTIVPVRNGILFHTYGSRG